MWRVNSKEAWDNAHKWAKEVNKNSNNICEWSWDCGFKLDYDGCLCSISSRFYPPHKSSAEYGKYHGTITVIVAEEDIHKKEVEADTLDELKNLVEQYVEDLGMKIKTNIKAIFPN